MPELPPPLANVVIPVFNKGSTVARTIASVMAQTMNNFDCVLVDDGSSDQSKEVIISAIENDARFRYIYQENRGVAHARNFGIALGNAPFVCCIDSDDEILPSYLEVCVGALRSDPSLGIAYSKLEAVHPDGRSMVSTWPGPYDFNAALRKKNQVHTAAVFRREAWLRTGGYRQRYAPQGAGSEDADFWLRIGLIGYGGILASSEPLFRYYLGGAVSGNSAYHEISWLDDKGWLASAQLPFAATSTPSNHLSHAVRQYDDPQIAVIIPVGPGHIRTVIDALDSVEGQTFRQWEVILIWDTTEADQHAERAEWNRLKNAFPYVRFHKTRDGPRGAGYARNAGAERAKAPLLLFLDADDWLTPTALADMMQAHIDHPDSIVYADYYGHAFIDDEGLLQRLRLADRLLDYNVKTHEAKVLYHAFDYDCGRAQSQPVPGKDPYIWNVISSLTPRAWHEAIGGFDEAMKSWEDWDYWVRMAKAGYCFHHLARPLMEYRFYTGERRSLANPWESGESGRQLSEHLLLYMQEKYGRIENMPCSSCGGRRSTPPPMPVMAMRTLNEGTMSNTSSDDIITVELIDGNTGDHLIAFGGTSYGYRQHGDRFDMKAAHARLDRRVRVLTDSPKAAMSQAIVAKPAPPPPPNFVEPQVAVASQVADSRPAPQTNSAVAEASPQLPYAGPPVYDFTSLWGINEDRAALLQQRSVRTLDGLITFGAAQISKLFGVPDATARRIIVEAERVKKDKKKK